MCYHNYCYYTSAMWNGQKMHTKAKKLVSFYCPIKNRTDKVFTEG